MCTGEGTRTGEKVGVVTCRFIMIERSRGFLVEQRAKHWAELCQDLRKPGSGRPDSGAGMRSVSVKFALSFHPASPPQILLSSNYTPTPFDEESTPLLKNSHNMYDNI